MKELYILPRYIFAGINDASWLKLMTGVVTALINYVLPTSQAQQMTTAAAILIILDTITGVIGSISSGTHITSARFGRVIIKLIGYSIAVVVVGIAANTLPGAKPAHEFLMMILVGSIIITECISIAENLDKMGVPIPKPIVKWLKGRKKDLDGSKVPEDE